MTELTLRYVVREIGFLILLGLDESPFEFQCAISLPRHVHRKRVVKPGKTVCWSMLGTKDNGGKDKMGAIANRDGH